MSDRNAKERLVELLDREAFEPVLRKPPGDYPSPADKHKLADVQGATRREQQRYHADYSSAQEVADNFHRDLSSEAAKDVDRKLHDLHLPTLRDVEGTFDGLCQQLGVHTH